MGVASWVWPHLHVMSGVRPVRRSSPAKPGAEAETRAKVEDPDECLEHDVAQAGLGDKGARIAI